MGTVVPQMGEKDHTKNWDSTLTEPSPLEGVTENIFVEADYQDRADDRRNQLADAGPNDADARQQQNVATES
jgi:hypothetical protein